MYVHEVSQRTCQIAGILSGVVIIRVFYKSLHTPDNHTHAVVYGYTQPLYKCAVAA